ncbi:porin [Methylococcus sp. Mc7]|uniref:porin n=1 Tax=Methylococcus sp. Mc7 TaxID=2860258 RepID=UPI002105831D|nr:porin [Methylococcus sp. Mc7]
MRLRKLPPLMIAAGPALVHAPETFSMTMEERMQAMEQRMLQLENKLEKSEQENADLKLKLAATQKLVAATAAAVPKPAKVETGPSDQAEKAAQARADKELESWISSFQQWPTEGFDPNKVTELHERVTNLEKTTEAQKAAAEEKAKKSALTEIGDRGIAWSSADGNYKLALRGYLQADFRTFFDGSNKTRNPGSDLTDSALIRRARLTLEGQLFKWVDWRVSPDFANSQLQLFDAFIDAHYIPEAALQVGKMRVPMSLERYKTATNLDFVERGYPAQIAPNRDVGAMLHGQIGYPGYKPHYSIQPVFRDWISYEFGWFNGTGDSTPVGQSDVEVDQEKDIAARVFSHPFLKSGIEPLEGLGIGVAGTWGNPINQTLNKLISVGQQTIFNYGGSGTNTSAVVANGNAYRYYPQAYWYYGPFGLLGEYLWTNHRVLATSTSGSKSTSYETRMDNRAWNLEATYVLTGERDGFFGIKPQNNFDPLAGNWGAFVLAGRWTGLAIDSHAFEPFTGANGRSATLANPLTSVSSANSWGVALNWYLNPFMKMQTDYNNTYFQGGGGSNGENRRQEQAWFTRFQIAY